jgi:hypothetical protein
MADVIITGNVSTLASAGSTTPAITLSSSVIAGDTIQGTVAAGGKGDPGTIIVVSNTAPTSPKVNDLWVDTT